jgi:hypothetical protein
MVNKLIVFVFLLYWIAHKMGNVNDRTKEKKRKRVVLFMMQMVKCNHYQIIGQCDPKLLNCGCVPRFKTLLHAESLCAFLIMIFC